MSVIRLHVMRKVSILRSRISPRVFPYSYFPLHIIHACIIFRVNKGVYTGGVGLIDPVRGQY